MENENKENKEQGQEMEFDTWDEQQFYNDVIVPKMKELSELLDSRKIPHLIHIVYSEKENGYGVGTMIHANGRKNISVAKLCSCGEILDRSSDLFETMTLVAIAEKGK